MMFLKVHSLFILHMFLEIGNYKVYKKNKNKKNKFDVITELMHKSIHDYEKHADRFI